MNRTSTEKLARVKPGPFFDQAQVAGLGGIRATRRDPEMRPPGASPRGLVVQNRIWYNICTGIFVLHPLTLAA
jgi:hypothetical protein